MVLLDSEVQPKPNIGVDRLVYASLSTDDETAGATYGTPVAMPGLVEVAETPNADVSTFFADDGVYIQTARPGAVQTVLTAANITAEIVADLLGATYSASNGQIVWGQDDVPQDVAVGFRSQLPNGKYEYVWYMRGIFTRAAQTKTTKADSITYQTEPVNFNVQPIKLGNVLSRRFSTDDPNAPVGLTDAALKSITTGWFSDPNIVVVAPGTPVADFAVITSVATSGGLDATWTVPTGATVQRIEVLDIVSGDYVVASTLAALTATSASATITGLLGGNTYTARLVVTSGANNGISNTDSAAAKV